MSQAHRTGRPLPVLSTDDHAAIEAAFLAAAGTPKNAKGPSVPDSPTGLWNPASRSRISVLRVSDPSLGELGEWLAPLVVVTATND